MLTAVTEQLAQAGFDLAWPFATGACARESGLEELADPARGFGLLVGNTRALWPVFQAARAADPALAAELHALDRYTERAIDRIAATVPGARVFYAHRRYGGAFLPFQRLAVAAGIGTLSPSQLVIHPEYGPWFALRAVLSCAGEAEVRPPPSAACTCDVQCVAAFERALAATGPERWRAWLAVRDACPVGRQHRYTDEQIAYHYSFLRWSVA